MLVAAPPDRGRTSLKLDTGAMIELDRVELLLSVISSELASIFSGGICLPIAQEQSLDIIQFTGEAWRRRPRGARFRRLGGLERRDGRRNDRGDNAEYFRRQTEVCNHRQTGERSEHSYVPREAARLLAARKPILSRGTRARWSHSSRRCLIRDAAHSHFGCGAASPVELAIAASALTDDKVPETAMCGSMPHPQAFT